MNSKLSSLLHFLNENRYYNKILMKNIHVLTHHDLDGVVSLMIVKWAFPKVNVTYTAFGSSNSEKIKRNFIKLIASS